MRQIGIVLIDDYPELENIAQRFIQQDRALSIIGTTTNRNALEMVSKTRPEVVILDLGIATPGILETIASLRSRLPALHIIAVTLFDEAYYRNAVLAAGAEAVVSKDVLYRNLVPCIHRIVNAAAAN